MRTGNRILFEIRNEKNAIREFELCSTDFKCNSLTATFGGRRANHEIFLKSSAMTMQMSASLTLTMQRPTIPTLPFDFHTISAMNASWA
jgi:hypothetical protein